MSFFDDICGRTIVKKYCRPVSVYRLGSLGADIETILNSHKNGELETKIAALKILYRVDEALRIENELDLIHNDCD